MRLLPYYAAMAIGMGALASVISLLGEIRDEFGLSETELGLVVGAGFLTAFLTQLQAGKLADRGYAPVMVRIGLITAAISMVGFALGSTFWQFLMARAVLGFAIGIAQPAVRRTVILAAPEHTGRNIGRLGLAEVMGFALAPAIVGLVAEVTTLDVPFYVLAGVIVLIIVGIGELEADEGARDTSRAGALALLRDRRLVGTLLIVTSEFLLIGAYEAVWAVMLTDQGAATWEVGLSFTIFAIPLGAFAPLGGTLAQRGNGMLIAFVGLGFSGIVAVLFGVIDTVWGLAAVAFVASVGSGFGFPAGLYVFSRTVEDARQASAQGLLGATEVLLAGITAPIAAWLYDDHGREIVWVIMPTAMLMMLAAGLALRLRTAAPVPATVGGPAR